MGPRQHQVRHSAFELQRDNIDDGLGISAVILARS